MKEWRQEMRPEILCGFVGTLLLLLRLLGAASSTTTTTTTATTTTTTTTTTAATTTTTTTTTTVVKGTSMVLNLAQQLHLLIPSQHAPFPAGPSRDTHRRRSRRKGRRSKCMKPPGRNQESEYYLIELASEYEG